MELAERFGEIVGELTTLPQNEAQTRLWIIDRVLQDILGYATTEIVPEDTGAAGNRPDYTILPQTPHTWLLEAKSWNVSLADTHATQATTYAYQNGQRWVVLTNGQEWRLYDSRITEGGTGERLTMLATRDDPAGMQAFLAALTRKNVMSGGLETAARQAKLQAYLRTQLADPDGEAIKAIHVVVRKKTGLEQTSKAEIVAAFGLLKPPSDLAVHQPETADSADGAQVPSAPGEAGHGLLTLVEAMTRCTRREPATIVFPGMQPEKVKSWKNVFVRTVQWLDGHDERAVPVLLTTVSQSHQRILMNTEPRMADGTPMRSPVEIALRDRTIWLQATAYARDVLKLLIKLCSEVGVDPATIRLSLQ